MNDRGARFGYIEALIMPFYSREFYADVGLRWRGTGLPWLFLLLCATWIPPSISVLWNISSFVDEAGPALIEKIPPLVIEDGVATVDAEMPYEIRDPDENQLMAIVDTTGEITDIQETEALLLLTETDLQVRKRTNEVRIYSFAEVEGRFELTPAIARSWMEWGVSWFKWGFYPLCLLSSLLWQVPKALLLGLIGLLFVERVKPSPGFAGMLRVAVFAMTPVIVLDTLMWMLPLNIPGWWLFCLAAPLGYIYLAASAMRAESTSTLPEDTPVSPGQGPGRYGS